MKYTNLLRDEIGDSGKISKNEALSIFNEFIANDLLEWEGQESVPSLEKDFNKKFIQKYNALLIDAQKEVFENLPINNKQKNMLKKIIANVFSKYPYSRDSSNISGVVIAGFGEDEIYPSLVSYHVDGIMLDKLIYHELVSVDIGLTTTAAVLPFAQREMVDTFMEGIDPNYDVVLENAGIELYSEIIELFVNTLSRYSEDEKSDIKKKLIENTRKIYDDFSEKLSQYRSEKFSDPITNIVSILPKDELATVAESLVNITKFKRKVTMQSETVGGPIDVAVISKGDGFIWIDRKHYFKPELNPLFIKNKFGRDSDSKRNES